jgi:hypothetical protein
VIKAVQIVMLLAALLAQGPTAHYDAQRKVKIEGPVTQVEWVNPRAFVFVDGWAVEIGNPIELERSGWKRGTVHIGDILTIEGMPASGQAKQALASSVVMKSTGRRVFSPAPKKAAAAAAPAPRWPNGHVRLGPAPDKKGYWGKASVSGLFEDGRTIRMNEEGLLANLADADRVAPFQPWAKSVYQFRQKSLLVDDPIRGCVPPGGPRQFHSANGFQFIEQSELGRILVLHGGGNRNWRMIYTDGRPQGTAAEVVLGYFGNSVGKWEGDTLVVDSVGFNERFWFSNGGLPHTEALHLVERFTRTDMNTLKYEVTIDDPRTYTRPWKASWTIQWVPDEEIQEYFCEENAESTFSR